MTNKDKKLLTEAALSAVKARESELLQRIVDLEHDANNFPTMSEFSNLQDDYEASQAALSAARKEIEELTRRAEQDEAENKAARLTILFNHGHTAPYTDDGELQCGECRPNWDYKRLPLKTLIFLFIGLKDEEIEKLKADIALRAEEWVARCLKAEAERDEAAKTQDRYKNALERISQYDSYHQEWPNEIYINAPPEELASTVLKGNDIKPEKQALAEVER